MKVRQSTDRDELEQFLRRNQHTHLYALADLDDSFWPHTTWYVAEEAGEIRAVCLVLEKLSTPVLYAVCPPGDDPTRFLLTELYGALPTRFVSVIGCGVSDVLDDVYRFDSFGLHQRMILPEAARLPRPPSCVVRLSDSNHNELTDFFAQVDEESGEPERRFFEPYMLSEGVYFGIRENGELISAGGTHVLSRRYSVAALGNIVTRPRWRRRGHAQDVSMALCRTLQMQVHTIGLNVHVENTAAIGCYERLGFQPVMQYVGGLFVRRSSV